MKIAAGLRIFAALAIAITLLPSATLGQERFKVGVSLPLTGPFSEFGEAVRNGITLAVSESPERFGDIQFLYEDNQYEPKQAVTVFNKLADVDKVGIVFLWGNEPSLAVAPIAEARHIPLAAVSQYVNVSSGRRFVFRFLNNGSDYSQAMLEYLRSLGKKRILMLQAQLSFFEMLTENLKKLLSADEHMDAVESVLPSTTDFRTIITKLKTKEFDVLGLYLTPPQVSQFFKQAKELQFKPDVFGTTTFESKLLFGDIWPEMEGAVFTHNAVTDAFRELYADHFSNDTQLAYAANAYDFAMLTSLLFHRNSATLTPQEILKRYREAPPQHGASGAFREVTQESVGSYFKFDVVVRKIKEGKSVVVARKDFGESKSE